MAAAIWDSRKWNICDKNRGRAAPARRSKHSRHQLASLSYPPVPAPSSAEIRGQRTEVRYQKLEVRDQEIRRQISDVSFLCLLLGVGRLLRLPAPQLLAPCS